MVICCECNSVNNTNNDILLHTMHVSTKIIKNYHRNKIIKITYRIKIINICQCFFLRHIDQFSRMCLI